MLPANVRTLLHDPAATSVYTPLTVSTATHGPTIALCPGVIGATHSYLLQDCELLEDEFAETVAHLERFTATMSARYAATPVTIIYPNADILGLATAFYRIKTGVAYGTAIADATSLTRSSYKKLLRLAGGARR